MESRAEFKIEARNGYKIVISGEDHVAKGFYYVSGKGEHFTEQRWNVTLLPKYDSSTHRATRSLIHMLNQFPERAHYIRVGVVNRNKEALDCSSFVEIRPDGSAILKMENPLYSSNQIVQNYARLTFIDATVSANPEYIGTKATNLETFAQIFEAVIPQEHNPITGKRQRSIENLMIVINRNPIESQEIEGYDAMINYYRQIRLGDRHGIDIDFLWTGQGHESRSQSQKEVMLGQILAPFCKIECAEENPQENITKQFEEKPSQIKLNPSNIKHLNGNPEVN